MLSPRSDRDHLAGPHGRVGRDPTYMALPWRTAASSAHRFFERGIRVDAVRVEDVDVVETHPQEALAPGSPGRTYASSIRHRERLSVAFTDDALLGKVHYVEVPRLMEVDAVAMIASTKCVLLS